MTRPLRGLFWLGLGTAASGCGSADDSGLGFGGGGLGAGGSGLNAGAGGASGGAGALSGFGGVASVGGAATGGIATGGGGAGGSAVGASGGADTGGSAGMGPIVGDPIPLPTPVGCVTDVSPGVHDFPCDTTIDTVSIPEQCTKTACGVIIDVHGGMMSSQMEDKNTDLRALGQEYGYIVIQPNALQNPLLLNQRLFVADTPTVPADDTRVMGILTDVIKALHVDTNRIHMTGFSEGGYMTWRWFCAHSDLLASIAPGAAAWNCAVLANAGLTPPEIGCEMIGSSVPAKNIPVLYMQGMKDGLVDPTCADTWIRGNVLTALDVDAGTVIAGDPAYQSAQYVRTRYLGPDGVPFEYIQHQYSTDSAFLGVGIVGHCYPGSTDLTVTPPAQTVIPPDQLMAFGCKDQCEFTWGEEVVQFFMAHPKQ